MFEESFIKNDYGISRTIKLKDRNSVTKLFCDCKESDNLEKFWIQNFLRGKQTKYTPSRPLTIIDFCSSVGGLTLGAFEAAKALSYDPHSLLAVDIDANALATYEYNFKPRMTKHDSVSSFVDFNIGNLKNDNILSYEPQIIDPDLEKFRDKVSLFLAGPPCQGHSNLNNVTRRNDPRNSLYLDTVMAAILLNAKAIVLENVHTITSDHKNVVEISRRLLAQYEYHFYEIVLDASKLGGGQTRKRHFLIASKNELMDPEIVLKNIKRPKFNLKDIIEGDSFLSIPDHMHYMGKYSEENIKRINYLFDNDLYDLPNHVRPDCHKEDGHGYEAVYGRLSWDKPSPTITTGFLSPGRGRYIHPGERRAITPHEAARIQGFPDWFNFVNPKATELAKWIGDAVPSSLSYTASLLALLSLEE